MILQSRLRIPLQSMLLLLRGNNRNMSCSYSCSVFLSWCEQLFATFRHSMLPHAIYYRLSLQQGYGSSAILSVPASIIARPQSRQTSKYYSPNSPAITRLLPRRPQTARISSARGSDRRAKMDDQKINFYTTDRSGLGSSIDFAKPRKVPFADNPNTVARPGFSKTSRFDVQKPFGEILKLEK